MRSLALTLAFVMTSVVPALAAAPATKPAARATRPAPHSAAEPAKSDAFAGRYVTDDKPDDVVLVKRIDGSLYRVSKAGEWDGVGLFDGTVYRGVFQYLDKPAAPSLARASGVHRAVLEKDGSFRVHGEFREGADHTFENVWTRAAASRPSAQAGREARPSPAPSAYGKLPAFGEYVYVDELPEAITKVAPVYPEPARHARVQGTVMVQALVGPDGKVVDTMIVKGIPMLDAAAEACVRQWVFKPALKSGAAGQPSRPVAVWVAVPVKFTIEGARASD